jgi:hypothetical protein
MLLVLKVDGLEHLSIADIEAGKEINVTGIVQSCFFDDDYIEKLMEVIERDSFFDKETINDAKKKGEGLLSEISSIIEDAKRGT